MQVAGPLVWVPSNEAGAARVHAGSRGSGAGQQGSRAIVSQPSRDHEQVQPAERIPIINRIAMGLEAAEDWPEIDFILDQFGFRIEDEWQASMRAYVRHVVAHNGDDSIVEALDRYLAGHAGAARSRGGRGSLGCLSLMFRPERRSPTS